MGIWARNAPFMAYAAWLHLAALGLVFVVVVCLAIAIWMSLPRQAQRWVAPMIAGCAVLVWVYAQFLFLDGLQMNGRSEVLSFNHIGIWEAPAIATAIFVLSGVAARWMREATIGLIVLISAQSALLSYHLASNWNYGQSFVLPDLAPLWRVSKSDSIFVFVLDSLQSDVAQEALSDPHLASQFAGFTLYRNAAAVAPTTSPSMPTIHSGAVWDPNKSLIQQYDSNVRQRSFLAQLARHGYDTTQINPIRRVCADGTKVCIWTTFIVADRYDRFAREFVRLIDLSLLRASPFFWKEDVYNNGVLSQLFSSLLSDASAEENVVDDLAFLGKFSENMQIEPGRKTAKFIHLLSTHRPFFLDSDCKRQDRTAPEDPVGVSRCSLRGVAKILSRLKSEGAFESALIIVVADHGGMRPIPITEGADRTLGSLMAAASSAIMVRLPGVYGPLKESDARASVADVASTVCEFAPNCVALGGRPLRNAEVKLNDDRQRVFNYYVWKHEYSTLSTVPNVKNFGIAKNVQDPESWRLIGPIPGLKVGGVIDFRDTSPDRYLGLGWSAAEPWGRWTEGRRASLRFAIDAATESQLTLHVRASALIGGSKKRQDVVVTVNNFRLGEWAFEQSGIFERSIRIPASAFRQDGVFHVDLEISSPASPRDIGLGDDTRALGIALFEARIISD
jgi:hypothetical protein